MVRTVRLKLTYRVGERVPIDGSYVCVPCGYRMHFAEGDEFPACIGCMRVSRPLEADVEEAGVAADSHALEDAEFDEELVAENLELWEFLEESRGRRSPTLHGDADYRKK